jgi:hypothetical protein
MATFIALFNSSVILPFLLYNRNTGSIIIKYTNGLVAVQDIFKLHLKNEKYWKISET